MFRRISLLNRTGFLQKKDKLSRGFLFSPLLLIPLFLVGLGAPKQLYALFLR